MTRLSLLAAAALALATASDYGMPFPVSGESRRDPHKPKTRYRRNQFSPAQRLLERQRQRNMQKKQEGK